MPILTPTHWLVLLALKKILETKKRSVLISYTGAVGRPENAAMIKILNIPAFLISEEQVAGLEIIAVVVMTCFLDPICCLITICEA